MDEHPLHDENNLPPEAYAGFWIRLLASILDSIIITLLLFPLILYLYGASAIFTIGPKGPGYYVINYGLPLLAAVIFWHYRGATPGKMMMDMHIVDADTLGPVPFGRLVLRYLGYYVSLLPVGLGFIWIAFDPRKQGWHDKIARTVVIKDVLTDTGEPERENANQDEPAVREGAVPPDDNRGIRHVEQDEEIPEQPVKKDPWKE